MRELWRRDDVTYHGKHYNFEAGISINPKPVKNSIPMWTAAEAEPAVQRAAKMADGWVMSPGWTPDLIEERIRFFKNCRGEFGRSDQMPEIVVRRDAHLADNYEAARSQARGLYQDGYRGFPATSRRTQAAGIRCEDARSTPRGERVPQRLETEPVRRRATIGQ